MLVNKRLSQELYNDAGENTIIQAKGCLNDGRVDIIKSDYQNSDNFSIEANVRENDDYKVNIEVRAAEIEVASCECKEYINSYRSCEHILATLMKFEQIKFWDKEYVEKDSRSRLKSEQYKYRNFNNLINTFYNEDLEEIDANDSIDLPKTDKVKIEAKITYNKFFSGLKVEFKIGNKRMYRIKDLPEFYTRVINNEFYKYGEYLEFVHNRNNFDEKSRPLLDFILKYAEIIKNSNANDRYNLYYSSSLDQPAITLGQTTIDDMFDLLKDTKVAYDYDSKQTQMVFKEKNPNIQYKLTKVNDEDLKLSPNIDIFKINIFKGNKYTYILKANKLFRCDEEYTNSIIKLIKVFRENYTSEILLKKENLKDLYSTVIPKIGDRIKINGITEEELEKYKPVKLKVKIYLDFDKNNYITADVKFRYQDEEFNPIDENVEIKYPRNILEENKYLNLLKKSGFMLDVKNSRFILPDDDEIYDFLTDDIKLYMQKFDVLVTENFKSKEIKQPKIGTIGVKVENNLLNIDLSKLNISAEEIQEVMKKYKLKKKFHRLKDGSYIRIENNEEIEFLDKLVTGMDVDYKDLAQGSLQLPVNRSFYLNELLKKLKKSKSTKDTDFKRIIRTVEKNAVHKKVDIPKSMDEILRNYQKAGYKWLKILDSYKFGGILADDMGLGKTIQLLALILSYVEGRKRKRKPSIVVSPSSLSLNWLKEAKKFAPDLKVEMLTGTIDQRKKIFPKIGKCDLVITSYDVLKKDIEKYNEMNYNFKYIIADEAQYLKNSDTQNAKAIKKLNGETRFALTGTPIENSLAELWSIFDFIMPGYLFSYRKFKNEFEMPIIKDENEEVMEKLKTLIEPFILRRIKKEVLTELPEKTITVLNNSMNKEQEKIYMSYLVKAKQEVADEINIKGFEKSQMMILAALTRLRQICCHPGLFISDYKGQSSKLNQCIEIIDDAVKSGHRILLFSGYTSMFEFIQKELAKRKIKFFKLTGATKVSERIDLVDEFNTNQDIKVFLISLKAGGTGLNLTGADMVIHFDPWWNASSENQATDRAYRIGQKNNVQVYKLITNNSIEEKIYELQQKKSELIDNMLSTNAKFISKFSQEEIMELFE